MGVHHIKATIFILCITGALSKTIFYSTVPSHKDSGDLVYTLPNDGSIEYKKNYSISALEANRFSLTKDGRLIAYNTLSDLHGRRIAVGVDSRNKYSGKRSQQNILLRIVNDESHDTVRGVRSVRRHRRATEISISKSVSETDSEVSLDYASVGVIQDTNNRYYLQQDNSLPFSGVDLRSGKLIVNLNRRLDYETAPDKRYQLIVFINNTMNGNGEFKG